MQTDHLIPASRPHLVLINKKKIAFYLVDFTFPVDHWLKIKESEKTDKYLDLARGMKNLWNMRVTAIPMVVDALGTVHEGLEKNGETGKSKKNWDHKDVSIPEIDQNTKKSPGELRRFTVTLIPLKDHQL